MTSFSLFLFGAMMLFLAGCLHGGIETADNPVVSAEILDFNWERGVTTTYKIDAKSIQVLGGEPTPCEEKVTLSADQAKVIQKKISEIKRIHEGTFTDDQLVDGVIIEFRFTLQDGRIASTKLNNIRIDQYAELTQAVSDMVTRDIQFHQYDLKRHR